MQALAFLEEICFQLRLLLGLHLTRKSFDIHTRCYSAYYTITCSSPQSVTKHNLLPRPSRRLITSAASSIGLALIKHLISKSHKVIMADLHPASAAIASSLPGLATSMHPEVSSWPSYAAIFAHTYSLTGSIDFFAANAGINDREDVFERFVVNDDEP